jgi:single-strand DNA-binding protein
MANVNKVLLLGRLTRDPELRYTPNGTAVCDLGIAVSRKWKSPDGSWKEDTCFVDVTVWQKQAEYCAEYLKKGREVFIEGRLTLDQWQSPEGQKRSKLKVVAQSVQFLGARPGGAAGGGGPAAGGGGAPPAEAPVEEPPVEEGPGPEPPF